ncbi:hypothetical protein V501_05792 [Pseudogymnoascus sp. VKM F-4519 (FW-2642)]|nr:hypothetical protein V501_05792 [Pseudogymnoascus sp. VKM F-4519 (FW-2642)]
MSFAVKQSKGCAPCRAKRTKCDQARPSCSQCIRARRSCHGYKDLSEHRFVDQTQKFVRQGRAKSSPTTTSYGFISSETSSRRSCPESKVLAEIISPALRDSLDFQATCYFLRNYSWEGSQSAKGFFDYIPDVINCQGTVGTALTDVVISLGMVGISHTKSNNSSVMYAAKVKYNRAVSATNRALCTQDAKADQTLITVMLLGLFETNTCNTPRSMKSWTQHINGAAQILYLRGKEQLQTETGRQIFRYLRTQIVINSMQRRAAIPETITSWSLLSLPYESGEDLTASKLSFLVIEFCNLRSLMTSMHDFTNSAAIVSAALMIEASLAAWAAESPYRYNIVPLMARSDAVFADYYHTYSSILTATSWNSYRSVRILLNELLIVQLSHLCHSEFQYEDEDEGFPNLAEDSQFLLQQQYQSQISRSRTVIVQLTQDICATVPYYLCDAPSGSYLLTEYPQSEHVPRAACGNLLLWPLFTAACTDMVSNVMRAWVVQRLEKIANVMGIQQARALAILLGLRKDPPTWHDTELTIQENGTTDEW